MPQKQKEHWGSLYDFIGPVSTHDQSLNADNLYEPAEFISDSAKMMVGNPKN